MTPETTGAERASPARKRPAPTPGKTSRKIQRGGRSAKRKGLKAERDAAKLLNTHLITLHAQRVLGSGAHSHLDATLRGDVQIRRSDEYITDTVEIKHHDEITISTMSNHKTGRGDKRILMCRQDRSPFLVSMWPYVWDELCGKAGDEPYVVRHEAKWRGVGMMEIYRMLPGIPGAVFWVDVTGEGHSALYMDHITFCQLLEDAYGEHEETTDGQPVK